MTDTASSGTAAERAVPELKPSADDRTEFERDRDIILYTSAFKRLSGITQVVSPHSGHVFHNRLTHSLQVAQVGRSLVQKAQLRQKEVANAVGLNRDAVEASCLAHDLGHPPFGHIAEETLNELTGGDAEGFEGNAQSFRIVSELAFRSTQFNGLNLTRATLRGILKYPWTFAKRPAGDPTKQNKWGAYASEQRAFEFATGNGEGGPVSRSVEAELMDWADDLTYAVHDAEDFYRAGLIPLHQLHPTGKDGVPDVERTRFLDYVCARKSKLSDLANTSPQQLDDMLAEILFSYFRIRTAYEGTRDQRAGLRLFTSGLVGRYINGFQLEEHADGRVTVEIDADKKREVAILKELTWCYVIENPSLALQQYAQKEVIRFLYEVFMQESARSPSKLLPPYYRERLSQFPKDAEAGRRVKRVVADLVAGMTELQAVAVYQRLKGIVISSGLEKILV